MIEKEGVIQVYDEVDMREKLHADRICKLIGKALRKSYPTRNWMVDVTDGLAKIFCPEISTRHAYCLHINEAPDILERKAVRAGGEILERFRLSRAQAADGSDIRSIPRNILGEAYAARRGEL